MINFFSADLLNKISPGLIQSEKYFLVGLYTGSLYSVEGGRLICRTNVVSRVLKTCYLYLKGRGMEQHKKTKLLQQAGILLIESMQNK